MYLVLLFILWLAIAAACHKHINKYFTASFIAACAIVITTQFSSYVETGFLDPFWLMTSITSFFMGGMLALIVGLPFKLKRNVLRDDS